MYSKYETTEEKGLFTFYREQAEIEEEMKLKKRLKKQKIKEMEMIRDKEREREREREKQIEKQQQVTMQQNEKLKEMENPIKEKRSLYQSKQKMKNVKIGESVIIINGKNRNRIIQMLNPKQRKSALGRIQEMINYKNNNRYFLQNREIPAAFGKGFLEKQMVYESEQVKPTKNVAIKPMYFNNYGEDMENSVKSSVSAFSYDKLPELSRNKASGEYNFPKRYKSKRVEMALKSGNSELIREIRKNIKKQSLLTQSYDEKAYFQYGNNVNINSEQDVRLQLNLNEKQRKLIEVIKNARLRKK